MHFIKNVFYWASDGCPEAVPAGIIAVNCADEICMNCDLDEVYGMICSWGIFDDTCWQLGFTNEDVDLIRKENENGHLQYLCTSQIVPDWQWNQIKNQPNMKVVEVDFLEYVKSMEEFDPEEFLEGHSDTL